MKYYTQNAWEGKNYPRARDMTTNEMMKEIRARVKKEFPDCKFSIRKDVYAGGMSIDIALMSADFNPFSEIDEDTLPNRSRGDETEKQWLLNGWKKAIDDGYMQVNQFFLDDEYRLSVKGKDVIKRMKDLISSYRYDDSDAMVDYFSTNFYYDLNIGKYDKPFTIKK